MFSRRFQGRKTSFEVCNWLVVLSGGTALRPAGGGPAGTRPLVTRDGWWVFTSRQGTDILDIPTRVQLLYNTLHIILNLMMNEEFNWSNRISLWCLHSSIYLNIKNIHILTLSTIIIIKGLTRTPLPVVLHCTVSLVHSWAQLIAILVIHKWGARCWWWVSETSQKYSQILTYDLQLEDWASHYHNHSTTLRKEQCWSCKMEKSASLPDFTPHKTFDFLDRTFQSHSFLSCTCDFIIQDQKWKNAKKFACSNWYPTQNGFAPFMCIFFVR